MPFVFRPIIDHNGALYELPRPILSLRVQHAWDFARFKVPMLEGEFTVGPSRQGATIAISGQLGTQAGLLKSDEEAMFEELGRLHDALHVGAADAWYSFFLYYDTASAIYRRFDHCTTARFEYDLSDPHLFTYSAVIVADLPGIQTDLPTLP